MDGSAWDRMLHNSTSEDPELSLVKHMQERAFPEGLEPLERQSKRNLPREYAKLMNMTPFKDEDGVIRCGGRLTRANLTFGRRHPAVIPEGDEGDALIGYIHAIKAIHQGRKITEATIRDEGYTAIGGKKRINKLIWGSPGCPDCRILRSKPMQQKMADLPTQRMEKIPPFQCSGMDVFGPFTVNNGRVTRANTGTRKIWVLLFTCLYSRGVHVETLWSMDVASFKMAFDRFEAVRGECLYLQCDAGSNFVGARNVEEQAIGEMVGSLDQDSEWVQNWMRQGTRKEWVVNPPKSSHFGGVWERAIGGIRKIIDATLLPLGTRLLSKEEFDTILSKAAAIVNSTPLWESSDSPNEPQPLSPAMLLTQRDNPFPCPQGFYDKQNLLDYGPKRWKRVEALADVFWEEWRRFYLYEIGKDREKWTEIQRNAKVGDVVLIKVKNIHRLHWPTGVVTKVRVSEDGLVRSATVKPHKSPGSSITDKERDRPIHDLVLIQEAS